MSVLDQVRAKFKIPTERTSATSGSPTDFVKSPTSLDCKTSKSPSAGFAGPVPTHLNAGGGDLERRIKLMARRWGYHPEELAGALAGAQADPRAWLAWTERDEQDFGGCVTREDFAQAYARTRRLA